MELEITLSEIRQFISNQYHIDIELTNTGKDKIEAIYIESVVLVIKEVKEDSILLHYEVHGLARLVAKVTRCFLKKKLAGSPIEWDIKNEEVTIDFKKFPKMKAFLKFLYISELHFVNDTILLVFYAREKHKI